MGARIPILALAGVWLSNWLNGQAVDTLYSIEITNAERTGTIPNDYLITKGNPPNIEKDVNESVDMRLSQLQHTFESKLEGWSANAGTASQLVEMGSYHIHGEHPSCPRLIQRPDRSAAAC